MKAISIRQPWAFFIVAGLKPVENRDWATRFRGDLLIHAGKTMTKADYWNACEFAHFECGVPVDQIPSADQLERGGIVGKVNMFDCVSASDSPWFVGEHGFLMSDAQRTPFVKCNGALSFFEVPADAMTELNAALAAAEKELQ